MGMAYKPSLSCHTTVYSSSQLSAKQCLLRWYLLESIVCGFRSLTPGCYPLMLLQQNMKTVKFVKFVKLKTNENLSCLCGNLLGGTITRDNPSFLIHLSSTLLNNMISCPIMRCTPFNSTKLFTMNFLSEST